MIEIEGETAEDKKLRGTVIGAIATVNSSIDNPVKEVDEFLSKQLKEFKSNPNESKISNDLKPAVMFYAFNKLDNAEALQDYFKLYIDFTNNYDRSILISCLSLVDESLYPIVLSWIYEKS